MAKLGRSRKTVRRLFVDQYGHMLVARTVRELKALAGGHCSRMYIDTADGKTLAVGYVVGKRWFREYVPVEVTR